MDFGAYLDGAKQSNETYICCLNTTCEIMCENWLQKLYSPILKNNNYQMVGVSGSYELCPKYVRDYRSLKNIKDKILTFFKRINVFRNFYRFFFTKNMKGFPNYSIRTSAFLINKKIFLDYFSVNRLPVTKLEAYNIENGDNSISNFILKNGYTFCVVDKFGNVFDKNNFDKSETYRSNLKNYIIKDRQHEIYENSNFLSKKYLRKICWGK